MQKKLNYFWIKVADNFKPIFKLFQTYVSILFYLGKNTTVLMWIKKQFKYIYKVISVEYLEEEKINKTLNLG